jgi:hypothetical protein
MIPDELSKRTKQAEGFIRALTQECHILDERRHILAPLIQDPEIQAALERKLDKTEGVRAWNHLAPLLGQDLLRDQARLFLDEDRRSGSLVNLWRKLQADPAIRDHFREIYGRMLDDVNTGAIAGIPPEISAAFMESFRQQDRVANYLRFDEGWLRIGDRVAALATDPVAGKIKTFRDKKHAHFEMQKLDDDPIPFDIRTIGLTFNEILEFGDRCQTIVAELGVLLTGASWDPEEYADLHAQQGVALWRTLSS